MRYLSGYYLSHSNLRIFIEDKFLIRFLVDFVRVLNSICGVLARLVGFLDFRVDLAGFLEILEI